MKMIKAILLACLFSFQATTSEAVQIERNENGLWISGAITEDSPRQFSIKLAEVMLDMALEGDRTSFVHLHLNLPKGGVASSSFRMVDIIRSAQSHGTKFVAHVDEGATCTSGCTFMFLAADERWTDPMGRLVFHGFSQADPEHPVKLPKEYVAAYYDLLKSANEPFFEFFKAAKIIEEDKRVGFTGKTLFERTEFKGLVTGLHKKK